MSYRPATFSKSTSILKKKSNKNGSSSLSVVPTNVQDRIKQRKENNLKKSPKGKKRQPPFIPPPGKSSPGRKLEWESRSHRLEINPPLSKTCSMHVDDLSTSEDDEVREVSRQYEKKIDRLLEDVSLTEREYLRKKTQDQLNASRRMLEDQETELGVYKSNLDATVQDYSNLRKSYDHLNKEVEITKNEAETLYSEKEKLMRKLLDVEMEGRAAISEVTKLKETCKLMKHDKKLTSAEFSNLTYQRDTLLEKLEDFERSNKILRKLLKDAHNREELDRENGDRCEILLQKLTRAEATIQDQSTQLAGQDRQVDALISQVEADKHQAKTFEDLQKTMEATRAHLQNQLRLREADNNRLSIQIKKTEQNTDEQSLEVEHYQGLLAATRDKSIKDKDALKKATRIQRERAMKQEEINNDLQRQVTDLIAELEHTKYSLVQITESHTQLSQDRQFLDEENQLLRKNILDAGNVIELSSKSIKAGAVHVSEKIISKVRQLKTVKLENDSMKDEIKTLEDTLSSSERSNSNRMQVYESELSQLKSALQQYENLTVEYKSQLERYRQDNEELNEKLRHQDQQTQKKLHESMKEVGEVRSSLQSQILDLEPYPELLKASEVRLQDAQERINVAERRATEHTRLIAELTQKVEFQMEQLDHMQNKYRTKSDDCQILEKQCVGFERKMKEGDVSHRELLHSINHKDETIEKLHDQLNRQAIENERLIQQLEITLSETKKQAESQKEKTLAKERSAQARIMDLEAQLSRSTQSTQMLKRSKEEAERKFNSRLQDMRDRLEQANNTTRSMQNYVQFLKTTYANVFTDDVSA